MHGNTSTIESGAPTNIGSATSTLSPTLLANSSTRKNLPREHTYRLSALLVIGDWIAAVLAIFTGLQLREAHRLDWITSVASFSQTGPVVMLFSLGGGTLFIWFMATMGTYDARNLYRPQKWLGNISKSIALSSLSAWSLIGLLQFSVFAPRIGVLYCIGTLLLLSALWRLAALMFLIQPDIREASSTRIIVVGWNKKVADLRTAMRRDIGQLSEIVGCVLIPGSNLKADPPRELVVLGEYGDLATHVSTCHAHSILLADLSLPAPDIQHLIAFCQREMLGFRMVPEYFPALASGLQVEMVSGVPLLSVSRLPLDRAHNRILKRGVDLLGGLVGLAIAAVVVPIFGAIVYAQSPGPIIYPQLRTSRNGRTFFIYKIRSMKINAEAESGAVWSKRDDPRRLKIGALMRKYNIDEIPQFWNVVKGDMSLVGPRPERPELIAKFKDEIPNYNARHEVRSGITGWAQIKGYRGDSDLRERIAADLYYLENWSLFLDFYCIVATFSSNKNAM